MKKQNWYRIPTLDVRDDEKDKVQFFGNSYGWKRKGLVVHLLSVAVCNHGICESLHYRHSLSLEEFLDLDSARSSLARAIREGRRVGVPIVRIDYLRSRVYPQPQYPARAVRYLREPGKV